MFHSLVVVVITFNIIISNQETWALSISGTHNVDISGGKAVSIEDAPYMAAVLYKSRKHKRYVVFCGGSIINEKFILTAAHCFEKINRLPVLRVSIGTNDLNDKRKVWYKLQKIICHEGYSKNSFSNDICLLKLTKRVQFGPKVAKLDLPGDVDFKLAPGTNVNVTGWGATENTGKNMTNVLHQITIPIVTEEVCRNDHKHLTNREICAGAKGHDACNGDSGGPLTYNNIQIGVVSYGEVCSWHSNGIGVYTSVASYVNWVKDVLENNNNTQYNM